MSHQGWKPRSRPAPFYASPKCEHPIEQWHLVNDERWVCRACEPQAEAGGALPSADAYRVGPLSAERTITLAAAFVAALPDSSRVDLPAGTVLREAPIPIQLASEEEERAILPRAMRVTVRSDGPHRPIVTIEDDAGRTIRLIHVGAAEAMRYGEPPEIEPIERRALGEQLHEEHDRITFERMIRPEHMPPPILEDRAVLATVGPEGATIPADPDPWLRGLTITTANAIRSGIDRGLPAKAGVAAVIAAFQAGVDMAIPPKP